MVLAALAGLFAERSGVVDIGLEGKMLGAAFAAASTAAVTGRRSGGLPAGIGVSIGLAMIHGFACITHRGDQVVSGMALNIMVAGLGPTLAEAWFGQAGRTPLLRDDARFAPITLPFTDQLGGVPIIGPIYTEVISGHNILVYVAALAVPIVAWVVYRTRFGLRLRAVGENPAAVDTAGICVTLMRYKALMVTGAALRHRRRLSVDCAHRLVHPRHDRGQGLSGAGRADLRQVAAGAGGARPACCSPSPMPSRSACRASTCRSIGEVPTQAIQALPYVSTVLLLAGFVGRAVAPKAIGVPYVEEDKEAPPVRRGDRIGQRRTAAADWPPGNRRPAAGPAQEPRPGDRPPAG